MPFSKLIGLASTALALSAFAGTPNYRIPLFFEQVSNQEFAGGGIRLRAGEFTAGATSLRFAGSNNGLPQAGEPLGATVTRIAGTTRRSSSAYRSVRYPELYPGIAAVFHSSGNQLEFDFELKAGADPQGIRLKVDHARKAVLDHGDLVLDTGAGEVRLHKPVVYQDGAQVDGEFRLIGRNEIGFRLGRYDRRRPLLIDPTVSFSTYFGGTGNDVGRAVAVDSAGSVYIAGGTTSVDLPVSASAAQTSYKGHTLSLASGDAFVAKFSSAGQLVYLTYLGGTLDDYALGLTVDAAGRAYVTGMTNSLDFPITSGAFQKTFGGSGGNQWSKQGDAFVAKLNPGGTALVYSTYLGGSQDETGFAIAVDTAGNAFVTGTSLSGNFPVMSPAFQPNYRGRGGQEIFPRFGTAMFYGGDVFVAKLNATGSALMYSTFVGGSNDDVPLALRVDTAGNAFVGGYTLSTDFPVTAGAFQSRYRGASAVNEFFNFGDGFIFKLNPTGTALVYSTYIGGSGDDVVSALQLDSSGNLVACGTTASPDLPTTGGAYQRTYGGPSDIPNSIDQLFGDGFVMKLNAAGSPVFITYLGGEGDDVAAGIALDGSGNIIVAGHTISTRFPVTSDAAQKTYAGGGGQAPYQLFGDFYLSQLSADGSKLMYSTYYGGSQDDNLLGLAMDASGNAYMVGTTLSRNFPVTPNAYRATLIGYDPSRYLLGDAVLVKFSGFPAGAAAKPVLGAIVNAGSGASGVVSPGMLFVSYSQFGGPGDLASGTYGAGGGPLGTSQSGTRILFDGTPAPLTYVSAGQSAGIVPYSVAGKQTVQAVLEYNGTQSAPLTLRVADAVPGLFSTNFSGSGQGAILNQNGSVNSASNPADRGSVIVLYGTGEGQTDPAGQEGRVNATAPFPAPKLAVSATVAGGNAQVLYAGAAPGLVSGVLQVNVQLPGGIGGGNFPVVIQVGGFASQANLTVAVK